MSVCLYGDTSIVESLTALLSLNCIDLKTQCRVPKENLLSIVQFFKESGQLETTLNYSYTYIFH